MNVRSPKFFFFMKKIFHLVLVLMLLTVAGTASAHQPRIIYGDQAVDTVVIDQPDNSQAFYGELIGQPEIFTFHLNSPLKFYWNLLVPDTLGAREDFVAHLEGETKAGDPVVAQLVSQGKFWTKYYEPYGGNNYFKGPEATVELPAGDYVISVANNGHLGKYVLVVGQTESFSPTEIWQTLIVLPSLKRDFFSQSPWRAYNNRVGQYLAVVILVLIFGLWLLSWFLGRKIWWLILGLVIIGLIVFIVRWFSGPTDYWQCQDGRWVKQGDPINSAPSGECLTPLGLERATLGKFPTVDQIDSQLKTVSVAPAVSALVQQYLFNNLNTLVPPEEATSTTSFQLTDVVFLDNSTAIAGYQVGSDVFRAEFRFTIDEPELVRALSFRVIGKN